MAKQLRKHLRREARKEFVPIVTSSWSGTTETSLSVVQSKNPHLNLFKILERNAVDAVELLHFNAAHMDPL